MEIQVRGSMIRVPNAIMTALFVLLTAVLFIVADDPRFAMYGSVGLILLGWLAKALEVNFSEVLRVLGKTEEDLPTEEEMIGELTEAIRPQAIGSLQGVGTHTVKVEQVSKIGQWLWQ